MRFLCLHGAGTNSDIFEIQTTPLRHELGDGHVYEFVEGLVPCEPFAGLQGLIAPGGEYFAYYEPNNSSSFSKALSDLKAYISEEGPFDGVIAFSQGSSLAAAVMMEQSLHQGAISEAMPKVTHPFRCAVFLSGRLPHIDAGDNLQTYGPFASGRTINVPTAHLWGANDKIEPDQHLALSKICKEQQRYIFVHSGEHEVPGRKDKESLIISVQTIKRMLTEVDAL